MSPTPAVRCCLFPEKVPLQSWGLVNWRCPAHLRPSNGGVMTTQLRLGVTISISRSQSLLPDPSFIQKRPAGGKRSLNTHRGHGLRYASCLSAEDMNFCSGKSTTNASQLFWLLHFLSADKVRWAAHKELLFKSTEKAEE